MRRSTGVFWRPYVLLISCTAIIYGFVPIVNATVAAMDSSASLVDIFVMIIAGLFLLFAGMYGASFSRDLRNEDDRDLRRSYDLIESIIMASTFLVLANLAFNFLSIRSYIGPLGLISSVFLSLAFWWVVLRE